MARRKKIKTTPIDVTEFIVSHDLTYLEGRVVAAVVNSQYEEAKTDLDTAIKVAEQLSAEEASTAKPAKKKKAVAKPKSVKPEMEAPTPPKDEDAEVAKPATKQSGWGTVG